MHHSKEARTRGEVRRRRRQRAERREATAGLRNKVNEKRRAEGHPGWVEQPSKKFFWL